MPRLGDPPNGEPVIRLRQVVADPKPAQGFGYAGDGAGTAERVKDDGWCGGSVRGRAGADVAGDSRRLFRDELIAACSM